MRDGLVDSNLAIFVDQQYRLGSLIVVEGADGTEDLIRHGLCKIRLEGRIDNDAIVLADFNDSSLLRLIAGVDLNDGTWPDLSGELIGVSGDGGPAGCDGALALIRFVGRNTEVGPGALRPDGDAACVVENIIGIGG